MSQSKLEKVVRPIVEGQIRGFLKEHPKIVEAVDWYKPRRDKGVTFVNSLSKRIVRDLTCGIVAARLAAALLDGITEGQPESDRGTDACGRPGPSGTRTGRPRVPPKVNRPVKKQVVKRSQSYLRLPELGAHTPRLRDQPVKTEAIGFKMKNYD